MTLTPLVLGAFGVIGLLITIVAAIGAFRSAGARTWRENAEAEEARADRLVKEKEQLSRDKDKLDEQWSRRQDEANAAHAKEIELLNGRITKLEADLTELRARPNVDDLAAAMKGLHTDFESQKDLLGEIRDALVHERRRDTSMRTRKTDPQG